MNLTFDCYGTLLDTAAIETCFRQISNENHLNGSLAANVFSSYKERLMYTEAIIPFEKLIKKSLQFMDMDLKTDHLFSNHYQTIMQAYYDLKPFSEAHAVLSQLKNAGNSLYLMSNSSSRLMEHHLQALGHLFDGVFTADDTRCYKPQLDFFEFVQDQLHLNNDNHIHIAKGFWWDIVPCTKMGWRKIWINRNHLSGLKEYQPYQELPDLSRLPEILL
ncbi:HAD-IA family hydrolase [Oenococcus kitaharae]|uniref:HAD-IA family hydrolase n=1 Tax=Oenococcus TaxID=46254 RepID=UPI0021E88A1D|nr:HAD-IA family hydrolase [Oenococcus kitaharae]MCV3296161.1 HAD-IA family hydrolase [Oenococcus kitaharae]